jgi:hypothetical protein
MSNQHRCDPLIVISASEARRALKAQSIVLNVSDDLKAGAEAIANSMFVPAQGKPDVFVGVFAVSVDPSLPAGHWYATK